MATASPIVGAVIMFKADRVFSQRNPVTGKIEWFFQTREGNIGPYETRDAAQHMLKEFIGRCIATGDDGGRNKAKSGSSLSLAPLGDHASIFEFDPSKRRKGAS
jgi:hypothetical protein